MGERRSFRKEKREEVRDGICKVKKKKKKKRKRWAVGELTSVTK